MIEGETQEEKRVGGRGRELAGGRKGKRKQ